MLSLSVNVKGSLSMAWPWPALYPYRSVRVIYLDIQHRTGFRYVGQGLSLPLAGQTPRLSEPSACESALKTLQLQIDYRQSRHRTELHQHPPVRQLPKSLYEGNSLLPIRAPISRPQNENCGICYNQRTWSFEAATPSRANPAYLDRHPPAGYVSGRKKSVNDADTAWDCSPMKPPKGLCSNPQRELLSF